MHRLSPVVWLRVPKSHPPCDPEGFGPTSSSTSAAGRDCSRATEHATRSDQSSPFAYLEPSARRFRVACLNSHRASFESSAQVLRFCTEVLDGAREPVGDVQLGELSHGSATAALSQSGIVGYRDDLVGQFGMDPQHYAEAGESLKDRLENLETDLAVFRTHLSAAGTALKSLDQIHAEAGNTPRP